MGPGNLSLQASAVRYAQHISCKPPLQLAWQPRSGVQVHMIHLRPASAYASASTAILSSRSAGGAMPHNAYLANFSLQSRRRHARRRQTVCEFSAAAAAAAGAATASIDGVKAAESTPAWNLRARWHAWWDLGGAAADKMPPPEKLSATLRRMWMLVRGETKLICAAALFMTLAALAELLIPHYVSASIFAIANKLPEATFYSNLKLLAVFSFSYGIFAGLRGFLFSVLATRLMEQLRGQVFDALIRQPVAFFDKEEVGALTSRLGSDCQAIVRCLATNLNVAVRNSLQCIGGAAYLLYMSRSLAGSCAAVSSLLWLVALRYGAFQRKSQRLFQDALADTGQVAEEVFTLSRVVRTFGTEKREGERYSAWLKRLTHLSVRQAAAYLLYLTTNSGLYYLTKVATLMVGGLMAMQGTITAQQLTAFVMYTEFVVSASLSVCDQWGPAMEALGASERVISYLDAPEAPQIASGEPLPDFSGHVEFRDLSFRYPTRQEVLSLNQVSVELQPGRLVALVGGSGSGKSTLVALLQRLYDSSDGQILVDGKDITKVDAGQYRRQIGVVSQEPHLLSMSIADNIAYGLEDENLTIDEIEGAARMANAHEFIMAFPRGYRTMVTDKLLSGGQRQRIALARALVRNPRLLILDEATSALDAASEQLVQQALDRAMKETSRSCLVIAHRLVTVRNADEILVMDKGRVVEKGDHESLLAHGGLYASLVSKQAGGGLTGSDAAAAKQAAPTQSRDAAMASRDEPAAAASMSVTDTLEIQADNIVPLTPKRERERKLSSLETGLSLDEEPDTDEMWADPGEGTHDVPDHASSRAP